MGIKINGISGTFSVPRVIGDYTFVKFDPQLSATLSDGGTKTVDVKPTLDKAWAEVVRRSVLLPCNEYFKTLGKGKTLSDLVKGPDYVIHCLKPKDGKTYADLPYANTSGQDIGLDPGLFFETDPLILACTLVHELAHSAGASTNASADIAVAHAAEAALPKCSCQKQYNKDALGRIQNIGFGLPTDRRYT